MQVRPSFPCRGPWRWVRISALAIAFGGASLAGMAQAQNQPTTENRNPMNILQLSAEGMVEVQQDWLTATLATTKEGRDAAVVQAQLQQAVEAALAVARAHAKPGELEVSSGGFSVSPRYDRNSKIDGWQGRAEISLQGRNFVQIMQAAAKMETMQVAGMGFGVSRQAREKVTGEAQAKAVEEFKRQAASLARNFGFAGFSLREVNVSTATTGGGQPPRAMMMAKAASAASYDAPIPVEAGKDQIVVHVSGSVRMQ